MADFGRENETMAQLGARLVAELTNDIRTELDVVHQVQQGKPLSVPTQGAVSASATPSPASAGAPAPATAGAHAGNGGNPQSGGFVTALQMYQAEQRAQARASDSPEFTEAVRSVQLEVSDASAVRGAKKERILRTWLGSRGYGTLMDAVPGDLVELKALLGEFDQVNYPEKFAIGKASGQGLGTQVYG